ncbi:hypothetical protein DVH05_006086 [Phytophthora capsici]|nr:hypothetical protein DVH05_006086 [Phytophthora capsici]
MLLEPSDIVGESCGSQFDSNPTMMASIRAELPALDKNRGRTVDFRGSNGSTSWLQQRTHIQRDEADPSRRDRNSERMKTRPSASAMVLERKRKRDEQRKLMNNKKQCTDSDSSEYNAADSERDSLDMEEQLTAFVEYNATDMDSLDINPSQDFDGDEEIDTATQASQYMQTCSWEDVTDVNQFEEEASEVFDNVIYAPRPASIHADRSASTCYRREGNSNVGIARPSFIPKAKEERAVVRSHSDDNEGSLSDGFDVAVNLVNKTRNSTKETHCSDASSKTASKTQWRQRRSVKRDCSFIDNSNNYSVNGRLLLMASPTVVTSNNASQTSDRVIELKDGCFDSSEDVQEVPMQSNDISCSGSESVAASIDTMTTSSSLRPGTIFSGALQPRLARKRRKVGQLTLDGFIRSKT